MTWEPRPLPAVTPETTPYWEAAANERLLLGECRDCGFEFHPPRHRCPDCLGATEFVNASGRGTIYTYTVIRVHQSWPDDHLPTVLGYIELEEGPRIMLGMPEVDHDNVYIGADVTLDFMGTELEGVGIPVARLVE